MKQSVLKECNHYRQRLAGGPFAGQFYRSSSPGPTLTFSCKVKGKAYCGRYINGSWYQHGDHA